MAEDYDWSTKFTRPLNPQEQMVENNTRLFWGRVFDFLIYPRPWGALVFGAFSWLPWIGPFFGACAWGCFLAFTVFWFMRGGGSVATQWMRLAFDLANGLIVKLLRKTPTMAQRLADEYRIEGQTAVRAASLGTAEGDQQAELQVAGWTELISTNNRAIDNPGTTPEARKQLAFLNAQLRERIRDVRAVYAQPVADPESIGDQRLSFFGPVAAANPFSWVKLLPWAVAALMSFTTGWFIVAERDARGDLKEAERQREITNAQLVAAEDVLAQYRDALGDAQEANQQNAEALEAERARVTEARARERRRQREIDAVNRGGDPPDWFGVMQQPEPVPGGTGDSGEPPAA